MALNLQALNLDNVSALRCFGFLLEEVNLGRRGLKIWKRLFSLNDVYGLWKIGEILYEGRDYMPMNQPDAFYALSRAAKKVVSAFQRNRIHLLLGKGDGNRSRAKLDFEQSRNLFGILFLGW